MIKKPQKDEVSIVQALAYEIKVREVMTSDFVSIGQEDKMSKVREILRTKKISGIPVVNKGKLIGIISIEDFIKCLVSGKVDATTKDWMTKEVKTLYADEQVVQAINKFSQFRFGRFPVIDRETDKLVGMLTKGDIIRGLLTKLETSYLEEEIHRYRASHIFEDIVADEITLNFLYRIEGQDFNKAGESSSNLKKTLTRLGIPPSIIRRISIATYEAEMNVAIFTQGGKILACIKPDRIKVLVEDTGPGIDDIEKAMQPGFSTAPEWVRELGFGAGMGLCNIKKCADEMKLTSEVGKGTNLEFTVFINRREK